MGLLPIWSGVCLSGSKKLKDTNAPAENWMRVVKNKILTETAANICRRKKNVPHPSELSVEMHISIISRLKLFFEYADCK